MILLSRKGGVVLLTATGSEAYATRLISGFRKMQHDIKSRPKHVSGIKHKIKLWSIEGCGPLGSRPASPIVKFCRRQV